MVKRIEVIAFAHDFGTGQGGYNRYREFYRYCMPF